MNAIPLCIMFGFLASGTTLPTSFQIGGFVFNEIGPSASGYPVVRDVDAERALWFSHAGMEVTLPAAVGAVDLRVCAYAGEVDVYALDGTGAVVMQEKVSGNKCVDLRLIGRDIVKVRLIGGSNEGMLVRICVALLHCRN